MATVLTKGEIVLFALRKFAIASNASLTDVEPQSIEDGVNDLEDMMSEWMINPGDIGYAFATGDEQPLPDDESGLPRKYKHAVGYQLLLRMLSDYSLEYRYDGTVKTVSNWPTDSGFTQYELGSVRDITRLRGRYAWSKDGTDSWFITDLEDESHPDRYSAQYRAESQPDGIIGIGTWRDFIVCFGSSTIEYFSLTGATTVGAALYVAQPSLMVQKGIAGTYCKTPFADSYAFISNPATGAPSVYIIGSGQVSPIANASIEKILRSYTADELADGVMESLRFDAHELLIIHLTRHVLVYDASSSANGPQWCVLKTGLYNDVYRAIDFIYEGNQITCGDKLESVTGKLQFDISSQYDKQQEHLLFTPLFKADNARCFDLEVESSTGVAQYADRLFLSATTDGINYGREQMIEQNEPFVYDKRVLWKRVGRIRKNVGFKLRVITKSPVTLSGCQIRIE